MSSFLNVTPNALGFEFSGHQPDTFLLMDQIAAVQAGKDYALVVNYETSGVAANSGLAWVVTDDRSNRAAARTPDLCAEKGGEASAHFVAPEGAAFVRLSLLYQRPSGMVRVEGKLTLKEVRLSPGS